MLQKFDPRNESILIYVKDGLYPRKEAKVSVFDSVVIGGDAVWEGIRIYNAKIHALDEHLNRLLESAHALQFQNVPSHKEIEAAIMQTLKANNMMDNAHIRLTLTRGEKITNGMDPRLAQQGCTLIVVAEWKAPVYDNTGIKLVTSSTRRNNPQFLDSKIHHSNLLNNILAKTEANFAGADDALMLDERGFVSETNATNFFIVKEETIYTPFADNCLPGITRKLIIALAKQNNISIKEKNISLTEVYNASQVFVSGTMGEITLVSEVDGRSIINRANTSIFKELVELFKQYVQDNGTNIN